MPPVERSRGNSHAGTSGRTPLRTAVLLVASTGLSFYAVGYVRCDRESRGNCFHRPCNCFLSAGDCFLPDDAYPEERHQ
jgi:hypothetical protein